MNRAFLFALATLAPAVAMAQLYKWVDEKGVTHYTETPPPAGREGKSVPIKPRTAPAPEPSKATPASPAKAGAPPAPGAITKAPVAEDPAAAELRQLQGDWKTAPGPGASFSMTIQTFGDSVYLGFVREEGGRVQVNNRLSYEFEGAKGQGRFTVTFRPSEGWEARMSPTRIDYRRRGDVLETSVTSSVFAGSYTLRR